MPPVRAPSPTTATTLLRSTVDAPELEPAGDPVGAGEAGRGVAVLNPVVARTRPGWGSPTFRRPALQGLEAVAASGQQLVHVSLVARVPQDDVAGGVEDPVQGQGQLDGAEVGPEMPSGGRHGVDDEGPDLLAQFGELLLVQALDICWRLDAWQDHGDSGQATPCPGAPSLRQGPSRVHPATPKAASARTPAGRGRASEGCLRDPAHNGGAPATQPTYPAAVKAPDRVDHLARHPAHGMLMTRGQNSRGAPRRRGPAPLRQGPRGGDSDSRRMPAPATQPPVMRALRGGEPAEQVTAGAARRGGRRAGRRHRRRRRATPPWPGGCAGRATAPQVSTPPSVISARRGRRRGGQAGRPGAADPEGSGKGGAEDAGSAMAREVPGSVTRAQMPTTRATTGDAGPDPAPGHAGMDDQRGDGGTAEGTGVEERVQPHQRLRAAHQTV